jgi:hypothetical protein
MPAVCDPCCSSANKAGNREGPGMTAFFFIIGHRKFLQNFMQESFDTRKFTYVSLS